MRDKTMKILGLVYETDKWISQDYNNKEEFVKDVMSCKNLGLEVEKLSDYFRDIYIGVNETNSNNPKEYKEKLKSLICELDYVGYGWTK